MMGGGPAGSNFPIPLSISGALIAISLVFLRRGRRPAWSYFIGVITAFCLYGLAIGACFATFASGPR
jgi:hypothetical protein